MSVTRIAEKAGVSVATVSQVLNNSRNVNPKLVEQVRRAAEELQLPLRPPRRRSRARSSDGRMTLAIMSLGQEYRGWFEMPVIASVVAELTRAAREQECDVMISEVRDPAAGSAELRRSEIAGGLAFINSAVTHDEILAIHRQIPLVHVMGGQIAPSPVDHVTADNTAVGYVAADYLASKGVEQMAYLTCNPSWDLILLRDQSFVATAVRRGLPVQVYLCSPPGIAVQAFGPNAVAATELPELIDRLLADRRGRLGLFVPRDENTVSVYRELSARGVRIGEEVVVVSCDNEAVRLATLDPRPASIDLNTAQIAHHAIRQLHARIKQPDMPPVRIVIPPRVVDPSAETAVAMSNDQ